mmetsp:Transcript_48708/g.79102  ORF Transcript_48708/g.79102 Transcript_48708/m.79102 type:complete len:258 (-) Transcript_48708:279-1052(-)
MVEGPRHRHKILGIPVLDLLPLVHHSVHSCIHERAAPKPGRAPACSFHRHLRPDWFLLHRGQHHWLARPAQKHIQRWRPAAVAAAAFSEEERGPSGAIEPHPALRRAHAEQAEGQELHEGRASSGRALFSAHGGVALRPEPSAHDYPSHLQVFERRLHEEHAAIGREGREASSVGPWRRPVPDCGEGQRYVQHRVRAHDLHLWAGNRGPAAGMALGAGLVDSGLGPPRRPHGYSGLRAPGNRPTSVRAGPKPSHASR